MAEPPVAIPQIRAWLVSHSGSITAIRHELGDGAASVGRGPQNDIVIQGTDVASVSLQHLEIRSENSGFRIHDLESTNGTYLNGERITEAELSPPAIIRLGSQGPELAFVTEEPAPAEMDRTQALPEGILPLQPAEEAAAPGGTYEGLLSAAVARARHARLKGIGDQTMTIMRETLRVALRHTSRRLHLAIVVLVAGLAAIAGGAGWKIAALNHEKRAIDGHIHEIEAQLAKTTEAPAQSDLLITQLADYQKQAEQLEQSLLYRVGPHEKEDFLTIEIRTLLAEFGAEVYSVPPEFTERVGHYIEQYQGPDRPLIAKALNGAAPQIRAMRQILEREQLPPDLAYIPLVESALAPGQSSAAGALGPWQLTAATGRSLGLRIDKETDERNNLLKSTRASCRYLRELILDFGNGSSVMLALAAYDLGPTKVKQAIIATVHDPIKQRNFWYLYRVNALPKETREYVPKVVAAMIIGRNPRHFGF
jgi:soluble lytic murein transglycosylase-like protein